MSLEGKSEQEITALATLANSVLENAKTRMAFQRMVKHANPNVSLPEVELHDTIAAAVKPHIDKTQELEAKLAQDTERRAQDVMYETLREEGVISGRKDFSEIVKYASEKGFQTNDAGIRMAATYRQHEQRSAEPTPLNHGLPNAVLPRDNKELMKNPVEWARQQAAEAMKELAKQKAA